MKKLLMPLIAAILVFSLCSCGASAPKTDSMSIIVPNMLENASLTIVDGTLTKAYASAVVKNGSTLELDSGNENDFFIDVQLNGVWYSLKEPEDLANTAEALIFEPGSEHGLDFSWQSRYGALPAGHYRLVKAFFTDTSNTLIYLADEFDIS